MYVCIPCIYKPLFFRKECLLLILYVYFVLSDELSAKVKKKKKKANSYSYLSQLYWDNVVKKLFLV